MNSQQRATEIHRSLPVVDGHNDLPWAIRTQADGSLQAADPRTRLDFWARERARGAMALMPPGGCFAQLLVD